MAKRKAEDMGILGDKVDKEYLSFIDNLIALAQMSETVEVPYENRAQLVRAAVAEKVGQLFEQLCADEVLAQVVRAQLERFRDVVNRHTLNGSFEFDCRSQEKSSGG